MIYRVEDGKLSVACLEVEYDRDLSSQLVGKSEWTATEDCWFQYLSLGLETLTQSETGGYKELWIELNGVRVSLWSYDNKSISDKVIRECSASLFMKKGDIVKIRWTNEKNTATFTANQTKVFPLTMKERK